MDYLARKTESKSSAINPDAFQQFELFKTESVKDIDEVERQIPQSIGFYTLEILEERKAELRKQIDDIDNKITAIKNAGSTGK